MDPDEPTEQPYHNFDKRQSRDKRGRWVVKLIPIPVSSAIVPLIPSILIRKDPAPSAYPNLDAAERDASQSDVDAEIPGSITAWGCAVALLVAVAAIVGLLYFVASGE